MYNFLFSNIVNINANANETSENLHWNERRLPFTYIDENVKKAMVFTKSLCAWKE